MLELRLVIGIYLLINAAMLVVWGLMHRFETDLAGRVINLNIVWGAVFAICGLTMTLLGIQGLREEKNDAAAEESEPPN